jgi:nitrogen-specific signal transduction histidine kinase
MATTLHPNSVIGLFNVMSTPLLTFAVNGKVTYANRAAKIHATNPVEKLNGHPVLRTVIAEIFTQKIKLPHGEHIKVGDSTLSCRFMQGMTGQDVACIVSGVSGEMAQIDRIAKLEDILDHLRADLLSPMSKLTSQLRTLHEEAHGRNVDGEHPAITASTRLYDRMKHLFELVSVFGDNVAGAFDRIDVLQTVNLVLAEMMPNAIRSKIEFDLIYPDYTLPPLYGSPVMIRRAFQESVENAIKEARKEVDAKAELTVQIRLMLQGQYIMLFVKSKGAKVAEAQEKIELKKLRSLNLMVSEDAAFQFKKVAKLGLPLVQRIVELHNGNMRRQNADSDAVELMIELPTGEPNRGGFGAVIKEQAKIYADELAKLKARSSKTSKP